MAPGQEPSVGRARQGRNPMNLPMRQWSRRPGRSCHGCVSGRRGPRSCGICRRRPRRICTTPACSGCCSRSGSAAQNSIMSRWSIVRMRSGRPTPRWPGIWPIWRAITGCSACSTGGAGSGLEQGSGRVDRVLLHFSGRPRQESRGRIPAARQLAVLVGRGFLRMEHARQRRFIRR